MLGRGRNANVRQQRGTRMTDTHEHRVYVGVIVLNIFSSYLMMNDTRLRYDIVGDYEKK